jgi:MoxR-like ATPase
MKDKKMAKRNPSAVVSGRDEQDGVLTEIPGTEIKMMALRTRHRDVPAARPYVFDAVQVRQIAVGVRLGMNIALTGPTGCGKTTLPLALASVLNRPVVRFNCHGETRVSNMIGLDRPVAVEGVLTLQFSERALLRAMREGYWVVFDEIDAAAPPVLFVLQSVLEEGNRRVFVPELDAEVVAAPGFQVFATGNTLGFRNAARAAHSGTNPMNDAFLDRFGMVIGCDYPSKDDEVLRVSANVPDCPRLIVEAICRVASELRADTKFRSDFSTRRCVQWARLVPELGGASAIFEAADCAVTRKMKNATDAVVFKEILQRICGGG